MTLQEKIQLLRKEYPTIFRSQIAALNYIKEYGLEKRSYSSIKEHMATLYKELVNNLIDVSKFPQMPEFQPISYNQSDKNQMLKSLENLRKNAKKATTEYPTVFVNFNEALDFIQRYGYSHIEWDKLKVEIDNFIERCKSDDDIEF